MTKAELEVWAVDEFWPRYKNLMKVPFKTKWAGGDRGDAITAICKLNPSEALRAKILAALSEQALHRAKLYKKFNHNQQKYESHTKETGLKIYYNRHGATWINNKGWESEIPSLAEIEQPTENKGLVCLRCPAPVPRKGLICKACETKWRLSNRKKVAEDLKRMGIFEEGDTLETLNAKCKKALPELIDKFRKRSLNHVPGGPRVNLWPMQNQTTKKR